MTKVAESTELASQEQNQDQILIEKLQQDNLTLNNSLIEIKKKFLSVYEEKKALETMPQSISSEMAEMKRDMELATHLAHSGVLPVKKAEEAFVILMTGKEMGLKPMESFKTLYIVKGKVAAWGDGMIAMLLRMGYQIDFINESKDGVTVVISNDEGFLQKYEVTRKEDALQRSKAMGFAPKNKMRFHGVRQIIKFHLSHLFSSVHFMEPDDVEAAEKRAREYDGGDVPSDSDVSEIIQNIQKQNDAQDLVDYYNALDRIERTKEVKSAFINRKQEILQQA